MTQEQGPMIALIAHDQKKPDMLAWARRHHRSLAGRPLVATGTTGSLLKADMPDLDILLMKSGPLGGDQQHAHLRAVGVGIEDLEVEFDGFHVERHMLFRFPSHELARLLLLDALDLDLLDDDVAAADGGHDVAGRHASRLHRGLDRVRDDLGIHHLALDNCVGEERGDGHLHQFGLGAGMVNHGHFDEAGPDIESY